MRWATTIGNDDGDSEGYSSGEEEAETKQTFEQQTALAKVIIPDEFPDVPLLPVPRSPIFPRFVKMFEVTPQAWRDNACMVIS